MADGYGRWHEWSKRERCFHDSSISHGHEPLAISHLLGCRKHAFDFRLPRHCSEGRLEILDERLGRVLDSQAVWAARREREQFDTDERVRTEVDEADHVVLAQQVRCLHASARERAQPPCRLCTKMAPELQNLPGFRRFLD